VYQFLVLELSLLCFPLLDYPANHTATKLTVNAEGGKAFRSKILGRCELGEDVTHQQVQQETNLTVRVRYVIRRPDIAAWGRQIGDCPHRYNIRISWGHNIYYPAATHGCANGGISPVGGVCLRFAWTERNGTSPVGTSKVLKRRAKFLNFHFCSEDLSVYDCVEKVHIAETFWCSAVWQHYFYNFALVGIFTNIVTFKEENNLNSGNSLLLIYFFLEIFSLLHRNFREEFVGRFPERLTLSLYCDY